MWQILFNISVMENCNISYEHIDSFITKWWENICDKKIFPGSSLNRRCKKSLGTVIWVLFILFYLGKKNYKRKKNWISCRSWIITRVFTLPRVIEMPGSKNVIKKYTELLTLITAFFKNELELRTVNIIRNLSIFFVVLISNYFIRVLAFSLKRFCYWSHHFKI